MGGKKEGGREGEEERGEMEGEEEGEGEREGGREKRREGGRGEMEGGRRGRGGEGGRKEGRKRGREGEPLFPPPFLYLQVDNEEEEERHADAEELLEELKAISELFDLKNDDYLKREEEYAKCRKVGVCE